MATLQTRDLTDTPVIKRDFSAKTNLENDQRPRLATVSHYGMSCTTRVVAIVEQARLLLLYSTSTQPTVLFVSAAVLVSVKVCNKKLLSFFVSFFLSFSPPHMNDNNYFNNYFLKRPENPNKTWAQHYRWSPSYTHNIHKISHFSSHFSTHA